MDVDQLPRDRLSDESVSCSEATHTQTKGILHGFDGTKSRFPQATSAVSVGPELPSSQFPSEQQWHPDFPHSASLGLGFAQHFAGTECACGACRHNDTVVHRGRDGMRGRESTGGPQLPWVSAKPRFVVVVVVVVVADVLLLLLLLLLLLEVGLVVVVVVVCTP